MLITKMICPCVRVCVVFMEALHVCVSLLEHSGLGIYAEFGGLKGFGWLYSSHFHKARAFCICIGTFWCVFFFFFGWQLSAHLCFLSVSGCLTFLSSFVCQHAWTTLYQCVCEYVRMGNEQSVMPEREPSLFKLPSGFQASHLQTGTSYSLSSCLLFSLSSYLVYINLSLSSPVSLPCLTLSVFFPLHCQFLSLSHRDALL